MKNRQIDYIDPKEDVLQKQAEWAVTVPMEERFRMYCEHIHRNFAMMGININDHNNDLSIYYLEDDKSEQ